MASCSPHLKRGDSEAWDEAFRRLYPPAFAAARHPLAALTPTEAEDVAIEALTLLLPKVSEVGRLRRAAAARHHHRVAQGHLGKAAAARRQARRRRP